MKLSCIFVGALATLVSAAPAKVEEEKRSSVGGFGGGFDAGLAGGFGGGFDAFGVGAAAFNLAPLAIGFGGGLATGNIFGNDILGAFNGFNVANPNIAFLLGANNFDFNSLFTFFDLQFAVNPFVNLFQFGAADVLNLQAVLDVNNALVFQWLLNQFGQELFFTGFGGFAGAQLPTLNFDILAGAGLGLQSQFAINSGAFDVNAFNNIANPFLNGLGGQAFDAFNFANLAAAGITLKE